MKIIQREGKSEYEVVSQFMKEFNLQEGQFTREIVEKGSGGFFNLFRTRPTVVKFFIPEEDEQLNEFLKTLLDMMGVQYDSMKISKQRGILTVTIVGVEEKGFLIGKEGRLLDSLQHLAYRVLLRSGVQGMKVRIDVDGYRKKQERSMASRIKNIAGKVKRNGRSVTLEPMKPSQRRVVHKIVEGDRSLRTKTVGNGDRKRVVILPDSESDDKHDDQTS